MSVKFKENVPLAPLTTFQIGGDAQYFVEVRTEDELREAVAQAHERTLRFVILAGGSNVLIPDDGLDALVIRIVEGEYSFAGSELMAAAGCNLLSLIQKASEKGLGGWEKLAGIPGSIGGAVRGNAGAFGPEIKDFITRVRAFDVETGEIGIFDQNHCDFSYRHSFFKDHSEWVIIHTTLQLNRVEPTESIRMIDETIAEREKRHLQNVRAAGSFFMNPVAPAHVIEMFEKEKSVKSRDGRVPAGWLIEKIGMKGERIGDAVASEQHPNYLVNAGNATAHDVRNLAHSIKLQVEAEFGIVLQEEASLLV